MTSPDGLPTPQRYWAMLAIAVGITMSVLDGAIANVALPTMARELGASPPAAVWIINAYQLTSVVTLLPFAALGERIGYRRVYQAGVAVFTLGSLACALSPSLPWLVTARVVQGVGAAGLMSVNGALVRFTYPTALLGRGVGLNALVVSCAAALGPTVASAILAVGPWPWLFAVNVPFGLVTLTLALRVLPASERSTERMDWTSAALNAFAFGLFFIGADSFTHGRGSLWIACVELVVALTAATVLIVRERRSARPLIPVDLLGIRIFALSIVASVCAFAAYMLVFLTLPFHLQTVLHRSQVETGLLMTPFPMALGAVALIAGRLSDRVAPALLGLFGMALFGLGLASLAVLSPHASTLDVVWRVALCGLGFGFFQSPNNRVMLSSAPRARSGAAGGMLATGRLVGVTTGATLAALVFHLAPDRAETIGLGLGAVLAVAAGVASLSRVGGASTGPLAAGRVGGGGSSAPV